MKRAIHRSSFIPAIVVVSVLLASPALAAEPRWEPVGPFGHDGYRLFPTGDPEILYVTSFYAGLYRSDDGGQSWREVNPMSFGALSVDPRDPDVLFGAPGIYEKVVRSVDGGRTFETDADGLLYQDQNPQILSFVRDPADPDVVFAATEFGLFRKDGARAAQGIYQWRRDGWQQVGAEDARFEGTVNGPLAFDAERGTLYAGTSTRGFYRLRLR